MEARRERRYGGSRCPWKPADVVILQRRAGLVLEFPGSAQAGWGEWEHGELDDFLTSALIIYWRPSMPLTDTGVGAVFEGEERA